MGKKNLVTLYGVEVDCSLDEVKKNQGEFRNVLAEIIFEFLKETKRI